MRTVAATFLLLTSLVACSTDETPQTEHVSAAYADLLVLRSYSASLDSARYAIAVDSILSVHNLTRTSFEKAMLSMGGTPEEVNAFFDSVNVRIGGPGTAPVDR